MNQDKKLVLAERVEWLDLLQYLMSNGFQRMPSRRDEVGIFRRGKTEIIVPLDRSLADYSEGIVSAAERIALAEGKEVDTVLADLSNPRSDILRVARGGISSESGTLALDEGSALLSGTRRALLAAAHSVERPEAQFHKRMTLKNAEAFVNNCRLGQTERGSFVLNILCPLERTIPAVSTPPFGRQALLYLLTSIGETVAILRRDGISRLLEVQEKPIITSNLCEAMVEMMPPDEKSDLWMGATFSPLIKAPNLPPRIQVDRNMFMLFEELGQKLRPQGEPKPDHFVGRVVELHGDDNDEGRLEGEIVLLVQVGDGLIRVRTALSADAYQTALDAHREQRYLSLHGVLRRRPKVSTLEQAEKVLILR